MTSNHGGENIQFIKYLFNGGSWNPLPPHSPLHVQISWLKMTPCIFDFKAGLVFLGFLGVYWSGIWTSIVGGGCMPEYFFAAFVSDHTQIAPMVPSLQAETLQASLHIQLVLFDKIECRSGRCGWRQRAASWNVLFLKLWFQSSF